MTLLQMVSRYGQDFVHVAVVVASLSMMGWWYSVGPEKARCFGSELHRGDLK